MPNQNDMQLVVLEWPIRRPYPFHFIMANHDGYDGMNMMNFNFVNWRVPTIRPVFLSQILTYKKVWELRKTNSYFRGYVAFEASQTNMIWGFGWLSNVTWMSHDRPLASPAMAKHCVPPSEVNAYKKVGGGFVWELTDVRRFQSHLFGKCTT